MSKRASNPNRVTVYTNDADRERVEKVAQALEAQGVDVRSTRGELSYAKVLRYLSEQWLKTYFDETP